MTRLNPAALFPRMLCMNVCVVFGLFPSQQPRDLYSWFKLFKTTAGNVWKGFYLSWRDPVCFVFSLSGVKFSQRKDRCTAPLLFSAASLLFYWNTRVWVFRLTPLVAQFQWQPLRQNKKSRKCSLCLLSSCLAAVLTSEEQEWPTDVACGFNGS